MQEGQLRPVTGGGVLRLIHERRKPVTPCRRALSHVTLLPTGLLVFAGMLATPDAHAARLKAVQSGTTTRASRSASATATITAVDPTKPFLVSRGTADREGRASGVADRGRDPSSGGSCEHEANTCS